MTKRVDVASTIESQQDRETAIRKVAEATLGRHLKWVIKMSSSKEVHVETTDEFEITVLVFPSWSYPKGEVSVIICKSLISEYISV